jgi:hypothetical protein
MPASAYNVFFDYSVANDCPYHKWRQGTEGKDIKKPEGTGASGVCYALSINWLYMCQRGILQHWDGAMANPGIGAAVTQLQNDLMGGPGGEQLTQQRQFLESKGLDNIRAVEGKPETSAYLQSCEEVCNLCSTRSQGAVTYFLIQWDSNVTPIGHCVALAVTNDNLTFFDPNAGWITFTGANRFELLRQLWRSLFDRVDEYKALKSYCVTPFRVRPAA